MLSPAQKKIQQEHLNPLYNPNPNTTLVEKKSIYTCLVFEGRGRKSGINFVAIFFTQNIPGYDRLYASEYGNGVFVDSIRYQNAVLEFLICFLSRDGRSAVWIGVE